MSSKTSSGGNQTPIQCPICGDDTVNLPRHIHSSKCEDTKQATLREAFTHG